MHIRYLILILLTLPHHVSAEEPRPVYAPPPSIITTESMLQMIVGLLVVLATIGLVAWLLKRFAIIPATTAGVVKIVATTGVGQRERVVIVEIGNTWLVLGVAPGRVNTLHSMDKASLDKAQDTLKNLATEKFPEQLSQRMNKPNA